MKKILLGLLVGAAIFAVSSKPASAAEITSEQKNENVVKHEVTSGDSLAKIAKKYKLESWRPIWNVNKSISDPNIIHPGDKLIIPEGRTKDRPLPTSTNSFSYPAKTTAKKQARYQNVRQTSYSYATPSSNYASTNVGGALQRVRAGESGGNYGAISPSGTYRGAYQFDYQTWRSVGGSGDPAKASPAEQDKRAKILFSKRGCSPWPNTCR